MPPMPLVVGTPPGAASVALLAEEEEDLRCKHCPARSSSALARRLGVCVYGPRGGKCGLGPGPLTPRTPEAPCAAHVRLSARGGWMLREPPDFGVRASTAPLAGGRLRDCLGARSRAPMPSSLPPATPSRAASAMAGAEAQEPGRLPHPAASLAAALTHKVATADGGAWLQAASAVLGGGDRGEIPPASEWVLQRLEEVAGGVDTACCQCTDRLDAWAAAFDAAVDRYRFADLVSLEAQVRLLSTECRILRKAERRLTRANARAEEELAAAAAAPDGAQRREIDGARPLGLSGSRLRLPYSVRGFQALDGSPKSAEGEAERLARHGSGDVLSQGMLSQGSVSPAVAARRRGSRHRAVGPVDGETLLTAFAAIPADGAEAPGGAEADGQAGARAEGGPEEAPDKDGELAVGDLVRMLGQGAGKAGGQRCTTPMGGKRSAAGRGGDEVENGGEASADGGTPELGNSISKDESALIEGDEEDEEDDTQSLRAINATRIEEWLELKVREVFDKLAGKDYDLAGEVINTLEAVAAGARSAADRAQASRDRSLAAEEDPSMWCMTLDQLHELRDAIQPDMEEYCNAHDALVGVDGSVVHICRSTPCPCGHGGFARKPRKEVPYRDEHKLKFLEADMHFVFQRYLRPASEGGSFALLKNPGGRRIEYYVSHMWTERFSSFVDTLDVTFKGHEHLWISAFALPADQVFHGDPSSGQRRNAVGRESPAASALRDSNFARALRESKRCVVCVDARGDIADRAWCVSELAMASHFEVQVAVAFYNVLQLPAMEEKFHRLDIRQVRCTSHEDRMTLHKFLHTLGSADEVNAKIRGLLLGWTGEYSKKTPKLRAMQELQQDILVATRSRKLGRLEEHKVAHAALMREFMEEVTANIIDETSKGPQCLEDEETPEMRLVRRAQRCDPELARMLKANIHEKSEQTLQAHEAAVKEAKAHEQTVQEAEDARREFEALRLGLHVELDHLREENTTLKGRVASLEAGEK